MRQRKVKNIDEKLEGYSAYIVDEEAVVPGDWRNQLELEKDRKLYLEIGAGKGRFVTTSAQLDPSGYYLAAEGLKSVVIRGLTTTEELGLTNVKFLTGYINDMSKFFGPSELNGIFLNFSDPWPKSRHEKRRLTYFERLKEYYACLAPGGFIRFKTDNDPLFEYSVTQFELLCEEMGATLVGVTRDLHQSEFHEVSPMTEYEEKFSSMGKEINYIEVKK